ncbi:Alpha/Beta hydrolase protein [Aspergillus carlsbadensis]|nr:Alpha/Beta hydrolase protein [Aspergillus carlsbadensis]
MSSKCFSTASHTSIHIRITHPLKQSNKPLLVFLHYWGGTSSTWCKLTSPEAPTSIAHEYPTAAVDFRGWGKSAGPSDDESAYSIAAMAADVASVLRQLQKDADNGNLLANGFVLIGHSMGAKVALATLSTLSDNLLKALRGIVLVAPAPPKPLILPTEMKEQQKVAYETTESVRWTVTNVLANVDNLTETDLETVVRDSLSGNPSAKAAWPSYGMEEDISQDVKKVLATLSTKIPIRVLAGELDIIEPRERVERGVCQFLGDAGADVSFRVVEGVKHLIPLERPEAIYEAVLSL